MMLLSLMSKIILSMLSNESKKLKGQKQAGHIWYQYLVCGLTHLGYTQSKTDECIYCKGTCVLLVYADNAIILGPDKAV
jgi:hypothetical protein